MTIPDNSRKSPILEVNLPILLDFVSHVPSDVDLSVARDPDH